MGFRRCCCTVKVTVQGCRVRVQVRSRLRVWCRAPNTGRRKRPSRCQRGRFLRDTSMRRVPLQRRSSLLDFTFATKAEANFFMFPPGKPSRALVLFTRLAKCWPKGRS